MDEDIQVYIEFYSEFYPVDEITDYESLCAQIESILDGVRAQNLKITYQTASGLTVAVTDDLTFNTARIQMKPELIFKCSLDSFDASKVPTTSTLVSQPLNQVQSTIQPLLSQSAPESQQLNQQSSGNGPKKFEQNYSDHLHLHNPHTSTTAQSIEKELLSMEPQELTCEKFIVQQFNQMNLRPGPTQKLPKIQMSEQSSLVLRQDSPGNLSLILKWLDASLFTLMPEAFIASEQKNEFKTKERVQKNPRLIIYSYFEIKELIKFRSLSSVERHLILNSQIINEKRTAIFEISTSWLPICQSHLNAQFISIQLSSTISLNLESLKLVGDAYQQQKEFILDFLPIIIQIIAKHKKKLRLAISNNNIEWLIDKLAFLLEEKQIMIEQLDILCFPQNIVKLIKSTLSLKLYLSQYPAIHLPAPSTVTQLKKLSVASFNQSVVNFMENVQLQELEICSDELPQNLDFLFPKLKNQEILKKLIVQQKQVPFMSLLYALPPSIDHLDIQSIFLANCEQMYLDLNELLNSNIKHVRIVYMNQQNAAFKDRTFEKYLMQKSLDLTDLKETRTRCIGEYYREYRFGVSECNQIVNFRPLY